MTKEFSGQVAVVTGGARGQGRSHALEFARRGADVVVCDIAADLPTVAYPLATKDELAETVEAVKELGVRCLGIETDVRDETSVQLMAEQTVSEFGRIDFLSANAGIAAYGTVLDTPTEVWNDVIGTNLSGVRNSIRAVLPAMLDRGFGRIITTASSLGRRPQPNGGAYVAAKAGLIALTKVVSLENYSRGITANAVCPSVVPTPMMKNEASYRLFVPHLENPTYEDALAVWRFITPYGEPYVEVGDVSEAVMFLASDRAKRISGVCLDVQAGWNAETPV